MAFQSQVSLMEAKKRMEKEGKGNKLPLPLPSPCTGPLGSLLNFPLYYTVYGNEVFRT
jgi:hypothetical protein